MIAFVALSFMTSIDAVVVIVVVFVVIIVVVLVVVVLKLTSFLDGI